MEMRGPPQPCLPARMLGYWLGGGQVAAQLKQEADWLAAHSGRWPPGILWILSRLRCGYLHGKLEPG